MIQDETKEGDIKIRAQRLARRSGRSRIFSGLLLVAIGIVLLLQKMNAPFPQWLFTWPVFLIAAGLFIGIRKKFQGASWLIAILVGAVFLANHMNPEWDLEKYTWPVLLIAAGVAFILRPRHHHDFGEKFGRWKDWNREQRRQYSSANIPFTDGATDEEVLDVVSVLGGTKKIIFSKDFKGGEVTSFLGGTELNLSQADIKGRVVLDLTQVLGGTKLIVPTHWDIKPELVSVFGGIEDKRQLNAVIDSSKVLILKGTSVFGGIEIRNF
jgi:predicted membrane protein